MERCSVSRQAVALGVALLFLATQLHAGDSWLSKVRRARDTSLAVKNDSALAVFDVTISLYNDPVVSDRSKYEDMIRFWADGVCEQSNGAHKLGKVRIFRNGEHRAQADVIWNQNEWPRANLGGFGQSGLHIWFGDVFPGGCGPNCDLDMLNIPEGAGYTMAHEWGHYAYALFDEYPQEQGDIGPMPSIMNSQWNAQGGHFEWLNHSTQNNFGSPQRSRQGRIYGKSGWDVLIQDPADDPKSGDATAQPQRIRYSALVGLEPAAADNWLRIELPGAQADCRNQLQIIWMDKLRAQLVLDVSGSMAGTPLANAKEAARNLVEIFPDNGTALGLVSFDNIVNQVKPVTLIPFGGGPVKPDFKAAISGLTDGAATAMFDAAKLALDNLLGFTVSQGTDASEVVFLLTDGLDNASSQTRASVTAAYQNNDVPLVTFGYGGFAPNGVLQQLADDTGGKFFASPVDLISVQKAFASALAAVSIVQGLKSSVMSLSAGGTAQETFVLDSTLASASVFVVYQGSPGDLTLSLAGPGGAATGISFDCAAVAGFASCVANIDPAALTTFGTGTWTVETAGPPGLKVQFSAFSQPDEGHPYHVRLGSPGGSSVTYPEPLFITAAVGKDLPITGVSVAATVTDPGGTVSTLAMNDAGTNGDAIADDGIYTSILNYIMNGTYAVEVHVNNGPGTARFTREGMEKSATVDGLEAVAPRLPSIQENFTRTALLQIQVQGVAQDDHPGAGPGTAIEPDNKDVAGRIDKAGDTDCFTLQIANPGSDLVIRITDLGLGMDPEMMVLDPATSSSLGASSFSEAGYVLVRVPAAHLPAGGQILACVRHRDPGATQGIYRISAGPSISSDVIGGQGPGVEIPTVSGVGLAVLALLLAGFGMTFLRRRLS